MPASAPASPADDEPRQAWSRSPLFWAAVCWMVGIVLGREGDVSAAAGIAIAVAGLLIGGAVALASSRRFNDAWRWRLVIGFAGLTVVATAAAWWQVRTVDDSRMIPGPPTAGGADASGRLVDLEATVTRDPTQRTETPGLMGRFDYRGPTTTFRVRIDRIHHESPGLVADDPPPDVPRLGRAGLLVHVYDYDDRLRAGDRVRLRGRLAHLRPPSNPGEPNFRQAMAERGVVGRLRLRSRGNIELLATADRAGPFHQRLLERTRGVTEHALRLGLPLESPAGQTPAEAGEDAGHEAGHVSETLGLLEALLLGRRGGDMEELEEVFQRTGLTHLLAISGLHLGILVAGTWWIVLVLSGRPGWAVVAAAGVVAGYVLMVPPRVPVIRAAVMTLAAVTALGCGRRISAMATMSAAALLLLIWRPWDLFTAGFQLSFAVVTALVLYARTTATWMWGAEAVERFSTAGVTLRHYGIDYLAISVVAWCTAMPLIAWHFGLVSPLAVVGAVVMLPFVAGLLWLGYVKVVVTAVAPPLGEALATPLWALAELTVALVRWAATLPGATMEISPVSGWWAMSALGFVAAVLHGNFAGRRRAFVAAAVLLVGWLSFASAPPAPVVKAVGGVPGVKLNMFSVGHGTAILVRSGGEAWMYDCGSIDHLDITTAAVEPALRQLGVRRIHTVALSHPDIDHFSGVLELIDAFDVQRVLVAEPFIAEAKGTDWSAARFLLEQIRQRGVVIVEVNVGWRDRLGDAEVEALWPPAGARFDRDNDASLVLRLDVAGRSVLLPGDIESEAMRAMLASGVEMAADVAEFPHHGAWTEAGPEWLEAVDPQVLLQSTNERRFRDDRWEGRLPGIERHVTALHGMIEVHVDADGQIHRRRFRETAEP